MRALALVLLLVAAVIAIDLGRRKHKARVAAEAAEPSTAPKPEAYGDRFSILGADPDMLNINVVIDNLTGRQYLVISRYGHGPTMVEITQSTESKVPQ